MDREGAGNDFETDGRLGMMSKSSTRGFSVPQPNPYRKRWFRCLPKRAITERKLDNGANQESQ